MAKMKDFIYDVCLDRFEGMTTKQIAAKYKNLGVSEAYIKEVLRRWYDVMLCY